ncbi:MAG TPA: ATP-binding cassette domain-containing protein, partial [Longimicrobiaceae bacterium]|nr:ATP-binding cassette domain-containing protein [Longimicrobiaceae bacterium]
MSGKVSRPLVRFDGVALGYGEGAVVENLSFTVDGGDILGIVGPNGAGKSTILTAMLGILRPTTGDVVYGAEVHRDLRFGYVPQR